MDEICYRQDCAGVTAADLEDLFRAAKLGGRTGDKVRRAFANSSHVCIAFAGERLVGASRAITDGEYHAFIYDVAVRPEFQRGGIGRRMLEMLLSCLTVWRVMLVAEGDVKEFYRHHGFELYPDVMARCDRSRLFDLPS